MGEFLRKDWLYTKKDRYTEKKAAAEVFRKD